MEVCSHTFVAHGSVPQLFLVVWIFLMSLGVFCYYRWGFSEDYKNYSKMGASWNYSLPFWFWPLFNFAILPKVCKPGKFESRNLALPIFEVFFQFLLNVNLSLNQTVLTLLYVRQTWMTQLILTISLWKGYLSLIGKDSVTHQGLF